VPEHTGSERPGGRTARTRGAVLGAVRELLNEPAAELTIPAVAVRSGVHPTTIYRRWRTIESLMLDVAVEDINVTSPVPVTGDLERDLATYVRHLLAAIRRQGHLAFFPLLLSAARQAATAEEAEQVTNIVGPRLSQFQAMLDAAGVTRIDAMRLVEIIIAPAYFWAQLGAPLDPDRDTARLVETALLACRDDHSR
jgi:AcrR family transcriptional regulator